MIKKAEELTEEQVYYGTGKRKDAQAKVWLQSGSGEYIVNDMPMAEYLHRHTLAEMAMQPFLATDTTGEYDVKAKVQGGGKAGQAGALRHGIARALVECDEQFRAILGSAGLLTRDPRVKERKHAGCRKARRGKQFSKR